MVAYADTSFLLSLYTADAHHEKAERLVHRLGLSLVFTPLQQHELQNAVRLAVFRKDMNAQESKAVLDCIQADLRTGFLQETNLVWTELFNISEALSVEHTEALGTRGMDVLHVAAARAIGATDFFTFDGHQKVLAEKAGFKVRP